VFFFLFLFFTFYLNYSNISKYFTEFPKTPTCRLLDVDSIINVSYSLVNPILAQINVLFELQNIRPSLVNHKQKSSLQKRLSCVGFVKTVTEMWSDVRQLKIQHIKPIINTVHVVLG
jgi:hypothetical protein